MIRLIVTYRPRRRAATRRDATRRPEGGKAKIRPRRDLQRSTPSLVLTDARDIRMHFVCSSFLGRPTSLRSSIIVSPGLRLLLVRLSLGGSSHPPFRTALPFGALTSDPPPRAASRPSRARAHTLIFFLSLASLPGINLLRARRRERFRHSRLRRFQRAYERARTGGVVD